MAGTHTITLTRYGIAEVLKWCIDRNHKQIPGTDAPAFQRMKQELKAQPISSDYFTQDQFWKQPVAIEFTDEEVRTVDRCLYENPNAESNQNPAIRYRFWVQVESQQPAAKGEDHS